MKRTSRLRKVRKYFVSGAHNSYRPYFLRVETVGMTGLAIILLFLSSSALEGVITSSNSPSVAAVVASSLVDLANVDRTANNLPPLIANDRLQNIAQMKADDMAAKSYFAHDSPDGHSPWYWFQLEGYRFSYAGENLAVYFSDSTAVNTAWMNSSEHRSNILNGDFTQVGIATARGMYQGQETVFVAEEFGTPQYSSDTADVAPVVPVVALATTSSVTESTSVHSPIVKGVSSAQIVNEPSDYMNPSVVAQRATVAPAVRVLKQTDTFIAVESANMPLPSFPQNTAGTTQLVPVETNPWTALLVRLITSPQTDLVYAYELISLLIIIVFMLEVLMEMRRPHPQHLVHGFSLVTLMIVLSFVVPTLFSGHLTII